MNVDPSSVGSVETTGGNSTSPAWKTDKTIARERKKRAKQVQYNQARKVQRLQQQGAGSGSIALGLINRKTGYLKSENPVASRASTSGRRSTKKQATVANELNVVQQNVEPEEYPEPLHNFADMEEDLTSMSISSSFKYQFMQHSSSYSLF